MAKVLKKQSNGKELNFDQMVRKFRKQVEKEEILLDARKHEYFVPKAVARKEKSKRHQKLMRKLKKNRR